MENQKQQNFFYDTIVKKLEKKSHSSKFFEISKKIENKKDLSITEFELMGMFAYIFGLDYTSQKTGFTKPIITNVVERLKSLEITDTKYFDYYLTFIKDLDINTIIAAKDKMKELLLTTITDINDAEIINIRIKLTRIVNNSSFPVKFTQDLDNILKAKINTYSDILKINSLIYEQIDLSGKDISVLNAIYENKTFIAMLEKASDYFEAQKYAIIYFDCIISLHEFEKLSVSQFDKKINFYKLIEFPSLLEELPETIELPVIDLSELETEPIETEKTFVIKETDTKNTDFFFKSVLEELLMAHLTSVEQFEKTIEALLSEENEDTLQNIYKYIKANKEVNRTEFESVYPEIDYVEFIDMLNKKEVNFKTQYTDLIKRYTAPIPKENLQKIITITNNLILSLVIEGGEKKAIFMQQIKENQIITYKHLHQIIDLIEQCKIKGSEMNNYILLRDYINNHEEIIIKVFEEIKKIEPLQIALSVILGFKEFYQKIESSIDSEEVQ